ncbi:hypothetical protein [uncultured Algoriphagus sp.]|uniref:hypothetical protein n=1 Tax=uncultured Algoriphagus sp. TaxID=417365 RepID=UPI002597BA1E|nr:hypothetical protein [uncultured Algoriphagus sp.]
MDRDRQVEKPLALLYLGGGVEEGDVVDRIFLELRTVDGRDDRIVGGVVDPQGARRSEARRTGKDQTQRLVDGDADRTVGRRVEDRLGAADSKIDGRAGDRVAVGAGDDLVVAGGRG